MLLLNFFWKDITYNFLLYLKINFKVNVNDGIINLINMLEEKMNIFTYSTGFWLFL